jgi:hypothetical protein
MVLYTTINVPPDDGPAMPETCRSVVFLKIYYCEAMTNCVHLVVNIT